MTQDPRSFYDKQYSGLEYASASKPDEHSSYPLLKSFVEEYDLQNKKCLEVGCGRGAFQDIVLDYTGLDLSITVQHLIRKPFCAGSASQLPFKDNCFDAIWTLAVLEHVLDPEKAMCEMRRVLKHDGVILFSPAWQCRPWAADGYAVRPYRDFDWKGKIIKASIPIRDSLLYRSCYVFPRRVVRSIQYVWSRRPLGFRFRRLIPNYEHCWTSDSDAVNSMDPYEVILWFVSRGDICLSHPNWRSKFFVRTGGIVFRIRKDGQQGAEARVAALLKRKK